MAENGAANVADGGMPQGMLMDTLVNLITGLGTTKDKLTGTSFSYNAMNKEQLEASYRGDWIARKICNIPAQDATREWREWECDKDDMGLIEDTERKLGIQRKVCEAMIKGRLYGGGALLIGTDDAGATLEKPLDPSKIQKDQLKYVHAVSRWDLSAGDIEWDITSPYYGQPKYYSNNIKGGDVATAGIKIHPSRIVRFLGSPLPDANVAGADGWSDSVLQAVADAIIGAGMVAGGGANLVNELKVDVIKVPELTASLSNKDYADRLTKRFGVANMAKSLYNMLLLDKEEEWERITANLAGLPDLLQMYLLIASGAADIPATRMLSQSPKGMNATGDSDTRNYYDHIKFEQVTTVEPAMNILDECIIRSSLGDITDDIGYEWKSLWQMDDVQKATMEKTLADAHKIDVDSGLIPAVILREARVNQLVELGTYPGLEQIIDDNGGMDALEGLIEAEAPAPIPGVAVGPDGKPLPPGHPAHALAAGAVNKTKPGAAAPPPFGAKAPAGGSPKGAGSVMPFGKKKAVGDALYARARRRDPRSARWHADSVLRTLYIHRPVRNSADILAWARKAGLKPSITAGDLHVTIAYSRAPVDWMKIPEDWHSDENGVLRVKPGGAREVLKFGTAIVLAFASSALSYRHMDLKERCDATWDYEDYTPHITLTYISEENDNLELDVMDVFKVMPYTGEIVLGPEVFREVTGNPTLDEFNEESVVRVPAGAPGGGQFGTGSGDTTRAGRVQRLREFVSKDNVKATIKTAAAAVMDRENQKEAFARACVGVMYHCASMDMGPDLEESVRDQIMHFSDNAKVTVAMARESMKGVADKLINTRLGMKAQELAGRMLRRDEHDEILDMLHRMKDVLDNDALFVPREGDPKMVEEAT